ncbi:hypothetical protein Pmani_003290 [Petrolisthes manimaculis]|uniref:Major facilitator superfamily associated domain-containing protein n=1 Tax=Petrolisthes manimaculis TaxID=1843537 RepID=A0AAE1UMM8_9EUCA|nr:hypothetical protein Pmani_003290 [Petrolisthes manimaculis]
MTIDWKMLPMKMHYFLRFMGTALVVLLPLITKQKGVPAQVVGVIWTVLPFLSLVTKITAGTIADYTRGHKSVLFGGVSLMMVSLTALYWVPNVPTLTTPTTQPFCPHTHNIIHNATHTHNTTTNHTFTPEKTTHTHNTTHTFTPEKTTHTHNTTTPTFTPYKTTLTHTPTPPLQPHCLHNNKESEGEGDWTLWQRYEFWLLFVCLLCQYCGHTVSITMQETVCFQMLGEERHKYGGQRVWGSVGIGVSAIMLGALVDWYSKGRGEQDYLPAHVLTLVFLGADLIVVARLRFPRPEKGSSSSARYGVKWWRRVLLVLMSTGIVGMACGLLWTFEFILVEDVAKAWQPDFPHLKLLLGLLMGVQCFLAEVPFLLLAGRIITRLGHINTFFVSLLGFCVRLCFYGAITNPWWFIPADLLHGVSFGIIYPCITSYASAVSPKGAVATTQAIFGATFFVSTGVGGLVGGQLYDVVGSKNTFLIIGAVVGVYAIVFLGTHALLTCCGCHKTPEGGKKCGEKSECEENLKEGRRSVTVEVDQKGRQGDNMRKGGPGEEPLLLQPGNGFRMQGDNVITEDGIS